MDLGNPFMLLTGRACPLLACGAARFACLRRKALQAIPAAQSLAPLDTPSRLSRIGHASAGARYGVSLFFATVSNS